MSGQTSAPAKAILLGEHAVVYGMPAIALPLSQVRAYVDYEISKNLLTVSAENSTQLSLRWSQDGQSAGDPVALMISLTARHFGAQELRGKIVIRSDIPIASGLGSGAAVSAALGRAVAAILGVELSICALNELVYQVEKLHHGTPSGIDNTVVVYEKPVYFVKDAKLEFMHVSQPLHLVVADTGIAALTRETVADVRDRYQRQPQQTRALLESIGMLTEQARQHIEAGGARQLGELMTQNHELLQRLGVSSHSLNRLVDASSAAGAYGAKLSGGGGGGNVIALVDENKTQTVAAALLAAGAKRVFSSFIAGEPSSA
ncbi:MAG: mevalonate kinase [Chloroflexi bacterium]|nr:mevalonate kinase [Chloroflexota bacterium]